MCAFCKFANKLVNALDRQPSMHWVKAALSVKQLGALVLTLTYNVTFKPRASALLGVQEVLLRIDDRALSVEQLGARCCSPHPKILL